MQEFLFAIARIYLPVLYSFATLAQNFLLPNLFFSAFFYVSGDGGLCRDSLPLTQRGVCPD